MTKKRMFFAAGVLAVLIAFGLGMAALIPERPGVTKGNFDRVHEGMTLAEVESTLGKQDQFRVDFCSDPSINLYADWNRDDGARACIHFHGNCVVGKDWRDSTETLSQKLRRWWQTALRRAGVS